MTNIYLVFHILLLFHLALGSKLAIKTPDRRHWCRSGVFIVNFEHKGTWNKLEKMRNAENICHFALDIIQ